MVQGERAGGRTMTPTLPLLHLLIGTAYLTEGRVEIVVFSLVPRASHLEPFPNTYCFAGGGSSVGICTTGNSFGARTTGDSTGFSRRTPPNTTTFPFSSTFSRGRVVT